MNQKAKVWKEKISQKPWAYGDPDKIYRGVDALGNICGESGSKAEDTPYLYFYNPKDVYAYRACVNRCPAWDGS